MLRKLLLPVFLLIGATGFGQAITIDYVLGAPIDSVKKFVIPKDTNYVFLRCDFAKSEIIDKDKIMKVRRRYAESVTLVFTRYRQSNTFEQGGLNEKRLEVLRKEAPELFSNSLIDWKLLKQTGATNDDEARGYLHGFLVKLAPEVKGKLTRAEEIEFVRKSIDSGLYKAGDTIRDISKVFCSGKMDLKKTVITDTLLRTLKHGKAQLYVKVYPTLIRRVSYANLMRTRASVEVDSKSIIGAEPTDLHMIRDLKHYDPISAKKRDKGIVYSNRTMLKRKPHMVPDTFYISVDTAYIVPPGHAPLYDKGALAGTMRNWGVDSIVYKSMSQMKVSNSLNNMIVVEDVTGSMNPYIAQTMMWRRLVTGGTGLTRFVFFNDGDNKPDSRKVIGSTGGVYCIQSADLDSVEQIVYQAMKAGNGGDGPENNVEAMLKAAKLYPDCGITLIADNQAPVKDIELIDQLSKPVNVILCGAGSGRIQADYLTIARKTGGTIRTIESDLTGAAMAKEGEVITVGGQKFVVKDGRFVLTR